MAKKSQNSSSPEVSSLPMSQDQSPLVIDLPDGQKLVVGHLSNGSVIEVATWRGTGRPDSRTSRLMLGMSSASDAANQAKTEDLAKSEEKKNQLAPIITFLKALLVKAKSLKFPAKTVKSESTASDSDSKPLIQTVATPAAKVVDTEVDEWLNKLLAKSEEKATQSASELSRKTKATGVTKKRAPKKSVRKAVAKNTTGRSR